MWEAVCLMALAAQSPRPPERFQWRERLDHYIYRTYSPRRTLLLSAETLFDQAAGGVPAGRYGRLFGAAFATRVVRNSVELAAAGLLDEDYRFRASGERRLGRRLRHALWASLLTSGERRRFAASRVIATASGAAFSAAANGRRMTGGYFASEFAFSYLGHVQNSLLAEFEADLRAFGCRIPRLLVHGLRSSFSDRSLTVAAPKPARERERAVPRTLPPPALRSGSGKAYDRRLGE